MITINGNGYWVDNADASGRALVTFAMFAYTNKIEVNLRYLDDFSLEKRGRSKCAQISTAE